MPQLIIWIAYTTKYREGGEKFARAARTLAAERAAARPELEVVCGPVESKREWCDTIDAFRRDRRELVELHFIGHSGMYGIMLGSRAWPEQFSPHEWRTMSIPFAPGARAYFHACRTARWFAPFFATTFGVEAFGHHGYTSFSRRPDRFVWDRIPSSDVSLYVVSVPGRRSHGALASVRKYVGSPKPDAMQRFTPSSSGNVAAYDAVADLYDGAFTDISVRRDEWRWLISHLPEIPGATVLDVGCGNGSMLRGIADRIGSGIGVDVSTRLIDIAATRSRAYPRLEFHTVTGPVLPLADSSVDVIVSFMSFRYLDWDPMLAEMRRVLKAGGRILLVDMAAAPAGLRDLPRGALHALRARVERRRNRAFGTALNTLVNDPAWTRLVESNPIRAVHEYRWYLESRFPGRHVETINIGRTSRLLAFDSGPLPKGSNEQMSYP